MAAPRHSLDTARAELEARARLAADPAGTVTLTYAEFLDWADEDTLAEWVDGKVVMTSPASLKHQHIGGFLYSVLSLYVAMRELGEILIPPFQMKLPRSGREPDLLFVAGEHLDRLRDTYLDGPADLVVEIVSPDSVRRDRVVKRDEYQQAGVPEYWLIDPLRERATFYLRGPQGAYTTREPDAAGVYRSPILPGFWLDASWLWRDPLPDVLGCLFAVAGDDFARYIARHANQRTSSGMD